MTSKIWKYSCFSILAISPACQRKDAPTPANLKAVTTLPSVHGTTMRIGEPYHSLFDTFVRFREGNFIAGPTCVKPNRVQFRAAEKIDTKLEYGETFERMTATASLKGSIEAPFLSSLVKVKVTAGFASSLAKSSFTRSIYTSFQWNAGNLSLEEPIADPYHGGLWIEPLGTIGSISDVPASIALKPYYWRIPIVGNAALEQERRLLLGKREERLLTNCGDEFVSQINLGAKFIVGIVYYFSSMEFAQEFSMKATAKIGIGRLSIRKTVFERDERLREILSSAYLRTHVFQEGGNTSIFASQFPENQSPTCPLKIPLNDRGEIEMERFDAQLEPCFDLYTRAIAFGKGIFQNPNGPLDPNQTENLKAIYYTTRRYDQAGLYQLQADRKSVLSQREARRLEAKADRIKQDITKFQRILLRLQHECKIAKQITMDVNGGAVETPRDEHINRLIKLRNEVCDETITRALDDYVGFSRERDTCYISKLYTASPQTTHGLATAENPDPECDTISNQPPEISAELFTAFLREKVLADIL